MVPWRHHEPAEHMREQCDSAAVTDNARLYLDCDVAYVKEASRHLLQDWSGRLQDKDPLYRITCLASFNEVY